MILKGWSLLGSPSSKSPPADERIERKLRRERMSKVFLMVSTSLAFYEFYSKACPKAIQATLFIQAPQLAPL
jgi:hypothetical protein